VKTSLNVASSKAVLVSKRIQVNGDSGYWLVVPAQTEKATLFVVAGFINEKENAQAVLSQVRELGLNQVLGASAENPLTATGRYLPSEAPFESVVENMFDSLSVAQLINQDSFESKRVYTGFMVLTENNLFSSIDGVELVTIGIPKSDSQVNWLSAFYAIEWSVFAGFAVFMWWRLLADAYKKQQSALLAQ
jgi:cytochrome oxidase assembly protein ShyY1